MFFIITLKFIIFRTAIQAEAEYIFKYMSVYPRSSAENEYGIEVPLRKNPILACFLMKDICLGKSLCYIQFYIEVMAEQFCIVPHVHRLKLKPCFMEVPEVKNLCPRTIRRRIRTMPGSTIL